MPATYVQLTFPITGDRREILIAQLSIAGFEGFEETDEALIASIPAEEYDEALTHEIAVHNGVGYTKELIPQQNWNAIWEAGFEPVIVPGFCTIRAGFHPPATDTPYEIIITPKMSFGTGHHATTRLMMGAMRELKFGDTRVLDFGTGTGILAILAGKLGASEVIAIDNDEWSVENATENFLANAAGNIQVWQGSLDSAAANAPFDIILANINRHILLQYMAQMRSMLRIGGVLLLSGILQEDAQAIRAAADAAQFAGDKIYAEGDWIALRFTAQSP